MNTFRYRVGEPGSDLTRAGLVLHAMILAEVWCDDPDAFQGVIEALLTSAS